MPGGAGLQGLPGPAAVMMPLMRKGSLTYSMISRSSCAVLEPAGGVSPLRKGQAGGVDVHGEHLGPGGLGAVQLGVQGIPVPGLHRGDAPAPAAPMAAAAAVNTSGLVPSPVKAAMPASAQAGTRMLLYSMSLNLSP